MAEVAVDFSRTYFDAFMDKLEANVRKHMPGGGTKLIAPARLSAAPGMPGAGPQSAASGADAFWFTSFGDQEQLAWEVFEASLRTSMVTAVDGSWEAAIPVLKSAIVSELLPLMAATYECTPLKMKVRVAGCDRRTHLRPNGQMLRACTCACACPSDLNPGLHTTHSPEQEHAAHHQVRCGRP